MRNFVKIPVGYCTCEDYFFMSLSNPASRFQNNSRRVRAKWNVHPGCRSASSACSRHSRGDSGGFPSEKTNSPAKSEHWRSEFRMEISLLHLFGRACLRNDSSSSNGAASSLLRGGNSGQVTRAHDLLPRGRRSDGAHCHRLRQAAHGQRQH